MSLLGLEPYTPTPDAPARMPGNPLNVLGMAVAILLGNIFTGILGAIVYAAIKQRIMRFTGRSWHEKAYA
jgi:hypothetical protein